MRPADIESPHPRPQLTRPDFQLLDGPCGFAFDDADTGLTQGWHRAAEPFTRTIVLPFAPETNASGIAATGFHPVVWYRRTITSHDLAAAGGTAPSRRILLHFGAVDHEADMWIDGTFVAHHVGGQTAFTVDITLALDPDMQEHTLVVRAKDDPHDTVIPRGKQDWKREPHSIWYHRTTGIWRSIWLESVPALHITEVVWTPDVVRAAIRGEVELSSRPETEATITIEATFDGAPMGWVSTRAISNRFVVEVPLAVLRNGQAIGEYLWSPESPNLVDLTVTLNVGAQPGEIRAITADRVDSYVGLRTVSADSGQLLLNDRPFFLRSVLQQGYWPDSHYTAPSVAAMRDEVELIKRLGFNSIRIHQKVEDARFLYWCDRLGLAVWVEAAAAYEFSARAVELYTSDWVRIVRSHRSHPSVIVWVPFNESWGIQHGAQDPAQRAFTQGLSRLTRALDPTRPVVSNDGWEHTDSDIATIHDYESSGAVLRDRYLDPSTVETLLSRRGPHGRRMSIGGDLARLPVMLTEFGGVKLATDANHAQSWGYSAEDSVEAFKTRLGEIFGAVTASSVLAGFCYTQLTDTRQEANGLCDENRVPKLPVADIRSMVLGTPT